MKCTFSEDGLGIVLYRYDIHYYRSRSSHNLEYSIKAEPSLSAVVQILLQFQHPILLRNKACLLETRRRPFWEDGEAIKRIANADNAGWGAFIPAFLYTSSRSIFILDRSCYYPVFFWWSKTSVMCTSPILLPLHIWFSESYTLTQTLSILIPYSMHPTVG